MNALIGSAPAAVWLALGALCALAAGCARRPRRRLLPVRIRELPRDP
jgi:hypothetical protein